MLGLASTNTQSIEPTDTLLGVPSFHVPRSKDIEETRASSLLLQATRRLRFILDVCGLSKIY